MTVEKSVALDVACFSFRFAPPFSGWRGGFRLRSGFLCFLRYILTEILPFGDYLAKSATHCLLDRCCWCYHRCTDEEQDGKRLDLCFEFAVESSGDVLKKFESVLLSLLNHGSPFRGTGVILETILYTERTLPVKTVKTNF